MPMRAQAYKQLADETAMRVTEDVQSWTAFLTTASRLYKYNYYDQLLIYAQRPEATACAEYDVWNDTMRRYVRRGTKGIALLDPSDNGMRVRYVFDVTDTGERVHSRPVDLWQLDDRHEHAVQDMLAAQYDAPVMDDLSSQLDVTVVETITQYWLAHKADIIDSVDGSALSGYDDGEIGASFLDAALGGTTYILKQRCGLNPELSGDAAQELSKWHTPAAAAALGRAINVMSGQVLRLIEATVKRVERSVEHDGTDLQAERRLPTAGLGTDRGGAEAVGQVRTDAAGISGGASPEPVHEDAPGRDTDGAPAGNRADSTATSEHDDAPDDEAAGRDGNPENAGSDDVGSANEQYSASDRGDDPLGADLRLTEYAPQQEQMSFIIPGESEQIDLIDTFEAKSALQASFASFIPQEVADEFLRIGSNITDHRLIMATDFAKQLPTQTIAAHMRMVYHGGYGLVQGGERYSAWYDTDGIRLARGANARYVQHADRISWEDAAKRIGELLDAGQYASMLELASAPIHERKQLAQNLWHFRSDVSADGETFLPTLTAARSGGFPDDVARLTEQLANTNEVDTLTAEMTDFIAALDNDPDLMRFRYQHPEEILLRLEELSFPRRSFESLLTEVVMPETFITGDEVDALLSEGGITSGGKGRIYNAFTASPTLSASEKAAFLKSEYGIGGHSHALSGSDQSSESHDSKGIKLEKGKCTAILLPWSKVAQRVDSLIGQNRFLTPQQQEQLRERVETPVQEAPVVMPALSAEEHSQAVETALQEWNGDITSKHTVVRYIKSLAETPESVDWLKTEFGDDLPLFPVNVDGESFDIPWEDAQERITTLVLEDRFYTEAEKDALENIDPVAMREELARRGIVGGEVVDEEAFQATPFLQQVSDDVERLGPTLVQDNDVSTTMEMPYHVGDTLYLENGTAFIVEEIGDLNVRLRDPSLRYPIARAESKENLARLLERYPQPEQSIVQSKQPSEQTNHPAYTSHTEAVYPAVENGLPNDVVIERMHLDEPERVNIEVDQATVSETQPVVENFRIMDDHLGEGGAKTKYGWNVEAIRTLQALEGENRQATLGEQETLARYVGWGGLSQAFDENNAGWSREYLELKGLLSEEEYASARASTLNAHYTSPVVIRAIYDAIGHMGFTTGNVLEPACGVGNFLGMLPESMTGSHLYGVELDSITGRLAKQLYPKADITVAGFETTSHKDFFDVAVGNVPFGSYKVSDRGFDRCNFLIHDYFFAKAIEQVRPGGVIAFITSKGTMDKQTPNVRKYIAQRAELLGAIRLPNNAFRANAGTEVTSDILFLQKREQPILTEPDWVHLGETEDGIPVNSYFAEHPEMVLGKMVWDDSMYGNRQETACIPLEGAELSAQLGEAVMYIRGQYQASELPDVTEGEPARETIPADPSVRNYSYTVVDGNVYYRQGSVMVRPDLNAAAIERVRRLVALRNQVQELIQDQMDNQPDEVITAHQQALNSAYDSFTLRFGLINARGNANAFSADASYYLLCSLEVVNEHGELERKADMFTKRTIRHSVPVTHVDTATEALAVSIAEKAKVDIAFMGELTGLEKEALTQELSGVIFSVPEQAESLYDSYVTADEYLSGNVREKLRVARMAAEGNSLYHPNVTALEAAQPKDLDASEIDVRLGATWVGKDTISDFMYETFDTPMYLERYIKVNFSTYTAEWNIEGKTMIAGNNIAAYVTYGTDRANGYRILEDTLNLRDVRIYDTVLDAEGKEKRVLNQKETTLAQQKQQAIKDAFAEWIWRDPTRREALVTRYNELFNSTRPREFDGSHIAFDGMTPEIQLREHQRNAVAHILYGGNTLLAHQVGAGKTFEMVAAVMESKRLGLCQKAMFVVPNHLTEQWASEFLRLYPSANILVATRKDFEKVNRQKFCGRIATGDYDAIIIGHSQFERIPVSQERQERHLHDQIDDITEGIMELKQHRGEQFSVKQLERAKRQLETRLKKLEAEAKKDRVVTFEQLGVDRLYVDEAHAFKNLFLFTKMRNVAGLSTSEAQKSSDMFLKCRYMDEITGGRGIVFATGTPVSNSMTELYTMQRYLQYGTLYQKGMSQFDCWASTFGETTTAIELAPEGTGYRARTRFAKFFNLPELMKLFSEVADIKTADQLNLPTPEAHYDTVVVHPSDYQRDMVGKLSERAAEVHSGSVDPTIDNMLKITSDGRKLGLDQRLINPLLPDDPGSKVNACVGNILRIWQDGQAEKLTQIVFCDLSTPRGKSSTETEQTQQDEQPEETGIGDFNIYEDIRGKLVAQGVPREQVAFIHEANTEARKKELFAKVRAGQVRVLLGSTAKMGAGTNIQDRLVALHDLDCPWRPGDLEQRAGRIVRQGNQNTEVHIYRYVTEATFDAYLWQTIENKQKFISQIMSSKSPVRSCEDVDETALSYAEIKALCAGDPRIKEKMDLDVDVARLKLMKADHMSKQYRLEDQLLKSFPQQIDHDRQIVDGFEKDRTTASQHPLPEKDFIGLTVGSATITDKEQAGTAILKTCQDAAHGQVAPIGSYRGFTLSVQYDSFANRFQMLLQGALTHRVDVGNDARGNLTRLDNAIAQLETRAADAQNHLTTSQQQMEAAQQELGKPFPQDVELRTKSARLSELDAQLNMDHTPAPVQDERASVIEELKQPCRYGEASQEPKDEQSR